MKVFDLACEHGHAFEGWFASAEAFGEQLGRSLVHCPVCESANVRRTPSAPRLNLSNAPEAHPPQPAPQPQGAQATAMPTDAQLRALWLEAARHLVRNTEDVGERFAEEARRIHYREAPQRGIRGMTTAEQRAELEDEGIDVFSFPIPAAAEEPLQ
ncbi:MAG: DUF1178 family protein [Burkholderiaceae bacterium]|nr:DUF1178 family protein [Burkholderiaceae bacterium]